MHQLHTDHQSYHKYGKPKKPQKADCDTISRVIYCMDERAATVQCAQGRVFALLRQLGDNHGRQGND